MTREPPLTPARYLSNDALGQASHSVSRVHVTSRTQPFLSALADKDPQPASNGYHAHLLIHPSCCELNVKLGANLTLHSSPHCVPLTAYRYYTTSATVHL